MVYMALIVMFPFPFHLPSLEYIQVLFKSNLRKTSHELNEMLFSGSSVFHHWVFAVGTSGKETARQCRRHETWVSPWVGKIPWRRACQPTPTFLLGKIPWIEEPGGLHSMGS